MPAETQNPPQKPAAPWPAPGDSIRTMARMARLKKGETPTPPRENRQKLIKQLVTDGGRRMVLEVDAPVNAHLENLYQHLAATEKGRTVNYQEAIRRAIVAHSKALGPAPEEPSTTTQQA